MTTKAKTLSSPKAVPPKRLKVGYLTFDVEPDTDSLLEDHDENIFGDMNPHTALIRYRNDLPHDVQAQTLLHESLHAAFSVTSLALSVTKVPEGDVEEIVVDTMASALLGIIRENPKFLAFLLHSE